MAASSVAESSTPRLRVQFTLGDILVFMFGISVGLAYWRWSETQWPTALFAAFMTWLVAGIVQDIWRDKRAWSREGLGWQEGWGAVLRIGLSLGSLLLLAWFANWGFAYWQHEAAGTLREHSALQLSYETAHALFYLAIMAVLWTPTRSAPQAGVLWRAVLRILDLTWMGLAAYWAAKVFLNIVAIIQLVHIAIRGVANAQPTHWAGKPFQPANFKMPPVEPLWGSLLGSFTALAVATAAGAVLVQQWQRGWKVRVLWSAVFMLATGCSVYLLQPAWSEEIYKVSPPFAHALTTIAAEIWPGLALLVVTLAAAVALNRCVSAGPLVKTAKDENEVFARRVPALVVLIVAISSEFVLDVISFVTNYAFAPSPQAALVSPWMACWYVGHVASEFVSNWPTKMLALATLLVIGRFTWQRWRGQNRHERVWLVQPGQFFVVWLVGTVVLALLVPLGVAWMLAMAVGTIPNS